MKIQLSSDLEKALLRAVAEGVCSIDIVATEELSKRGKCIYGAIKHLLDRKAMPPIKPASILLTAVNIQGAPKDEAREYLRSFRSFKTGKEISHILQAARDKAILVSLINKAGEQLASGNLSVEDIDKIIRKNGYATESIQTLSSGVGKSFPKPPRGIAVTSLPSLSKATNGFFGVWVIGGEAGLGKSTLSWQLSLDTGKQLPVIYYDLDGTGYAWFIERTRQIVRGKIKCFKEITRRIYYRENIITLEEDLNIIQPPALIVVDSIQTLPASVKYQKQSLDEWIKKFKDLSQKGYSLLLVSELNRASYGKIGLSGYKGSGDIEYGASVCLQLVEAEDDENLIEVHLEKNRHGEALGHIVNLERDKKKVFWFNEEETI